MSHATRMSPVVSLYTLGCKANQYDTERMRQELESRGAVTVYDCERAEVAVVNTCTVTNRADTDARRLIRRLRRRNPALTILVAGCSAAVRAADYRAMPEVDVVVSGHDPDSVADALCETGVGPRGGPRGRAAVLRRSDRGTRAWVKIQTGCDRRCSFCATRIARGANRSRPADEIVREAEVLSARHPELVLTGVHIGHYGRDLPEPVSLGRLCALLLEKVEARIRLTSIEATEIDDVLVDLLATSAGRLAPHLHVPLQSGSDRILRLMRRWHTREAYRRRVWEIADRLPFLGLGADVIVGFPGEGEEEFSETRALIRDLPYTYLHVFPYSPRDHTAAAALPSRVPGDVAAARSRELRRLAYRKGMAYRASRADQLAEIVVEGDAEATSGLSGDYLRVALRGPGFAPGDRLRAPLRLEGDGLHVRASEAVPIRARPVSRPPGNPPTPGSRPSSD